MVKRVASVSHTDDPTTAQTIPSKRTDGSDSKSSVEMTLVRIVSVTWAPTAIAPANSMQEAMTMACFKVRDRDATDVAKELATSLAPRIDRQIQSSEERIEEQDQKISFRPGRRHTNIPRIEEREDGTDSKKIVELRKRSHLVQIKFLTALGRLTV